METSVCNCDRGISRLDVTYKVIATLIKIWLEEATEPQLRKSEASFRKRHSLDQQPMRE